MILTSNETAIVITTLSGLFTAFLSVVLWILNKGVCKMETIANSLTKIERDFGVLVNDHTNLKEDVKSIDKRVHQLEKY